MHHFEHPALRIPEDTETLQESILQLAQMLRDESACYLMAAFGTSRAETAILAFLAAREEMTGSTTLRDKALPDISLDELRYDIFRLRRKIGKDSVVSSAGSGYALSPQMRRRVSAALVPYHKAYRAACGILGTTSLRLSLDNLSDDPARLAAQLQALLDLIRDDAGEAPLPDARHRFPAAQRVMLGVYKASLRDGLDFVIRHRFAVALFPPFVEVADSIDITANVAQQLHQIRHRLGFHGAHQTRHDGYVRIEEPIRRALGYAPSNASPPSRISSLAASSPGS